MIFSYHNVPPLLSSDLPMWMKSQPQSYIIAALSQQLRMEVPLLWTVVAPWVVDSS
jgi:hypothetical protein